MSKKMVYLAAPYSVKHDDPAVVAQVIQERMEALCMVDVALMGRGVHTITPLLKHYTLHHSEGASDWEAFKEYSYNLLERCDALYVVTMEGWEDSQGVSAEIARAKELQMQIVYVDTTAKVVGVSHGK